MSKTPVNRQSFKPKQPKSHERARERSLSRFQKFVYRRTGTSAEPREQNDKALSKEYTRYGQKLYDSIDKNVHHRAQSARIDQFTVNGLKYKIKVHELNKYSNKLKYGDFDWKIKYQVVGDKNFKPPQNELIEEIHYDTLLKVLRQTDWAKTPLYGMFLQHGRWVHEN